MHPAFRVILLLALIPPAVSCARPPEPVAVDWSTEFGQPLALLSTANGPLCFEFAPEGPRYLPALADAALEPLTPWPLARRGVAFMQEGAFAALAVNRWGFLAFQSRPTGEADVRKEYAAMYARRDGDGWADTTVGAVFSWKSSVATLLYRDAFFLDVRSGPPEPRVRFASPNAHVYGDLPFFQSLPDLASWDIDSLTLSGDGLWYARASKLPSTQGERAFLIGSTLSEPGRPASAAQFQQAFTPLLPSAAQGALRRLLDLLKARLGPAEVAVVLAQTLEGPQAASWLVAAGEERRAAAALAREDSVIQRAWAWVNDEEAWLLFQDGRGFMASFESDSLWEFAAPALGGQFVYTGFARVGDFCLATWEEQDGWAVGSAGFWLFSPMGAMP